MTDSASTGPVHPVLFVNPRSGGGKAQRYDLVARCRARGIEPVVMKEGDDLASLAAAAVSSGADVIGMAGGDGSQAIVAAVASRHDIPYVCIPAGTRNHFALDIGVDRDDVIGALDAFHHGSERRIDLAQVNGRVFVNNASIGFYGKVVQSPEYRDAKLRTVIEMLPDLLGPGCGALRPALQRPRRSGIRERSARAGVQQPLPARPARGSGHPGDDGRRDARRGGGARRTAVAPLAGMDHVSLRDRLRGHDRRRTGRRGHQARATAPIRVAPGGPAHPDSGRPAPSRAAAAQANGFFAVTVTPSPAVGSVAEKQRPRVLISSPCSLGLLRSEAPS